MAPKSTKEDILKCRLEFESGHYKSLVELASKYGMNVNSLRTRIHRNKWNEKKEMIQNAIHSRVEEKSVSLVDQYLSSLFLRSKKYEKIIDASQENLGAKTSDGTPLIDPDAIDTYTRSEVRLRDLAFSSLRIPTASAIDVTSGGKSLAEGLLGAISKLRDSDKTVDLTPSQVEYINSLEVTP